MSAWETWADVCRPAERVERSWVTQTLHQWSENGALLSSNGVLEATRTSEEKTESWNATRLLSECSLGDKIERLEGHLDVTMGQVAEGAWMLEDTIIFEDKRLLVNKASAIDSGCRIRAVHCNAPLHALVEMITHVDENGIHGVHYLLERGIDSVPKALEHLTESTLLPVVPAQSNQEKLIQAFETFLVDDLQGVVEPELASTIVEAKTIHGSLILSGLQNITCLPSGLHVKGSLWIRNCENLNFIAHDLKVDKDLIISLCDNLESLSRGQPLHVGGNLALYHCAHFEETSIECRVMGSIHVANCPKLSSLASFECGKGLYLTSLPSLMQVDVNQASGAELCLAGDFSLRRCPLVKKLPDSIAVEGNMALSFLAQLKALPANLDVSGMLSLGWLRLVKSLPNPLRAPKGLHIIACPKLADLPDPMLVDGAVGIESCPSLLHLPMIQRAHKIVLRRNRGLQSVGAKLSATGSIKITECNSLVELPCVESGGNLVVEHCASLRRCSGPIAVDGYLEITWCPVLGRLPDQVSAGEDVNFSDCPQLTSLPACIFDWGPTEIGRPHSIYLINTGLSDQDLESLRSMRNRNIRFHLRTRVDLDHQVAFSSLREAVDFWLMEAGLDEGSLHVEPYISQDNLRGVLLFLSKLKTSKEFLMETLKEGLAKRVVEALETLCIDDFAREEIVARIVDSVDACSDKPIWALNQLHILAQVSRARGDEDALRKLALGVMRLGIVHSHVQRKIRQTGASDDVCVYLKYEVELREELELPVSALDMLFPRYVSVTQEEFAAAKEEALAVSEDDFQRWLDQWPEWQRLQRSKVANTLAWKDLPRNSRRFSSSWTDLVGGSMEEPVRLRGAVWNLPDLLRHWVLTGNDLNNSPLSSEDLRSSISRCRHQHEN